MDDLTIVTLCRTLANITHNRCVFLENSNTCRCFEDEMSPKTTNATSAAPEIMSSEVFLIFFVLALWLSAIGFCLNQYKSLRRLETQVHYCVSRKDPLNIGDIKIVAREQDSIIYKKKRYSTVLDTHITNNDLKAMEYIREYLPKTPFVGSSAITALVVNRDDLTATIPLSTTTSHYSSRISSSPFSMPLDTYTEVVEEEQLPPAPSSPLSSFIVCEAESHKPNGRNFYASRAGTGRLSTGLHVPHISTPNSSRSSWNGSNTYDSSSSAQHLSVPSNSLRSNRYSDGNISLPVPQSAQKNSDNHDEQLLDPRLISNTVRRSLLALHRQSQENIHIQRPKEKTQSENDVNGAFTPWKIKMKSKLKRTHHSHLQSQQQQYSRPHSNTLSILPIRNTSNDQERRISEYATTNPEYRSSAPTSRGYSVSVNPTFQRSLKNYPKYSTQSTTESESTQNDLPMITSIYVSTDDNQSPQTILETDVQPS